MTIAKINQVCKARYGHEVSAVDSLCALWLAEHILETAGVNVFLRISNYRHKLGKGTTFPEYGTELFKTM